MKDINDILPKIPNMQWGALTNIFPTNANLNYLNKLLPHDKKWHIILESKESVDVDGVTIRRKTRESMT
jgi:hypothetical protein